ncbi:hypothetical protein F7R23_33730 [Burkholderia diffusa]|nr:hypothetical protein F7R23_33730 [Burkholderia diffusa]
MLLIVLSPCLVDGAAARRRMRRYATCCSRVVPEVGAPMSQTRHAFERCRHPWRKHESRVRKDGRSARSCKAWNA